MSEHALRQGNALVPAARDLLRLYSMRLCPFAQRTRLVLVHKNIPHEVVNINLKYKPSWFLEKNPVGLVPVIEYKGDVICESSICDEFLDEHYDQSALLPDSSFKRAHSKLLMHNFDKTVVPGFYGMLSRYPEKREKALEKLFSAFQTYETTLQNQKTRYFQGNACGMADFHFWPWFERIPAIEQLNGREFMPKETYPALNQWVQNMEELEAVKQTKLPVDWHLQFIFSLKQRDPQYDIGLQETSKI